MQEKFGDMDVLPVSLYQKITQGIARNTIKIMTQEKEIKDIILSVKGRSKDGSVESRRVRVLTQKGYSVEYLGIYWNFGTAGSVVLEQDGSFLAQLSCATGGRAKNGHGVNACHVYRVSK